MESLKLFMLLLGCKPPGRHTEQHDLFFAIGPTLRDLVPEIKLFWPETQGKIHIDGWREVNSVNGYRVRVLPAQPPAAVAEPPKLFFVNLGGYKPGELEEFHYKILSVATGKNIAIAQAKETAFFKHSDSPHIDDKYGVDVDDIYEVEDILPRSMKAAYRLEITPGATSPEDELHLGYFPLDKL
jgi:hypothetical protein